MGKPKSGLQNSSRRYGSALVSFMPYFALFSTNTDHSQQDHLPCIPMIVKLRIFLANMGSKERQVSVSQYTSSLSLDILLVDQEKKTVSIHLTPQFWGLF